MGLLGVTNIFLTCKDPLGDTFFIGIDKKRGWVETGIFYLNPVHKMAALKPDYKISMSSHFVSCIMRRNRRLYFHCPSAFIRSIKIRFYVHLMGPYIYTFWATHLKSHFGRMGKVIKGTKSLLVVPRKVFCV